ncbi:MAG: tetratricopeptide repeat protein [Gemmatimonadaceae bacterium]|nr:tetratricopeptide repeat protein [Gemmatimonadaceae bacterium]
MSQLDETLISARLGELIADARFADGLDLLNRCLVSNPGDAWLCGMRALLLLETGDTPGAVLASATAVEQAPMAAFAHWTRGVVLLRANDLAGAHRAAERAVALDPEESDTHVLRARVFLQKSQWESARAAVADAASHGADDEELMPLRAAIAAGRGLDVRAGDTWRAFAQQYPANALARTGHAWTLLESGDVTSARSEFEQARELDPTNAWALEGLEVTKTRLRPVHRRLASSLYGRVMARREETMVIAGTVLVACGLLLIASGWVGVVLPLALTVLGASLPMIDAWRRKA